MHRIGAVRTIISVVEDLHRQTRARAQDLPMDTGSLEDVTLTIVGRGLAAGSVVAQATIDVIVPVAGLVVHEIGDGQSWKVRNRGIFLKALLER